MQGQFTLLFVIVSIICDGFKEVHCMAFIKVFVIFFIFLFFMYYSISDYLFADGRIFAVFDYLKIKW